MAINDEWSSRKVNKKTLPKKPTNSLIGGRVIYQVPICDKTVLFRLFWGGGGGVIQSLGVGCLRNGPFAAEGSRGTKIAKLESK